MSLARCAFIDFPDDIQNVILKLLSVVHLVELASTCKALHSKLFSKIELWQEIKYDECVDLEALSYVTSKIGPLVKTIILGKYSSHPSTLLKAMSPCLSLDKFIVRNLQYEDDFWPQFIKQHPKITWIESHTNHEFHIHSAREILTQIPGIKHLALGWGPSLLYTQRCSEGIQSVTAILEQYFLEVQEKKEIESIQIALPLQFHYRRNGEIHKADHVLSVSQKILQNGGFDRIDFDHLKQMDNRLISGICSRPLDDSTCYYWNLCFTCKLEGFAGICHSCLTDCHKGHNAIFKYISTGAYCDCPTRSPSLHKCSAKNENVHEWPDS